MVKKKKNDNIYCTYLINSTRFSEQNKNIGFLLLCLHIIVLVKLIST